MAETYQPYTKLRRILDVGCGRAQLYVSSALVIFDNAYILKSHQMITQNVTIADGGSSVCTSITLANQTKPNQTNESESLKRLSRSTYSASRVPSPISEKRETFIGKYYGQDPVSVSKTATTRHRLLVLKAIELDELTSSHCVASACKGKKAGAPNMVADTRFTHPRCLLLHRCLHHAPCWVHASNAVAGAR